MSKLHARTAYPTAWLTWLLAAALVALVGPAWAQQHSAARVMSVSGAASAIDPQGRARPLVKGGELYTGDKVVTTESGLVQMRLHDGGYMSVRPGTEMVIDQFVHDEKDASKSSFLVSLLRGGFRSITGLIGRTNPGGYQIRSATATVGIRGTDHEPMFIPDTPGMQSPDAPPGLYDKVNEGETFIRNKNGVLALKSGDVGFSPSASDTPPQVLLKIPNFYRIEVRMDARDAKDNADGKPDGARRAGGDGLRPSVAARREALSATGGTATPATAPAAMAPAAAAPATPLLTPEQKKTIVQTLTATPPKTDVTAPATNTTTTTTPLVTPKITPLPTITPLQK